VFPEVRTQKTEHCGKNRPGLLPLGADASRLSHGIAGRPRPLEGLLCNSFQKNALSNCGVPLGFFDFTSQSAVHDELPMAGDNPGALKDSFLSEVDRFAVFPC
jgi:hypothetical protein